MIEINNVGYHWNPSSQHFFLEISSGVNVSLFFTAKEVTIFLDVLKNFLKKVSQLIEAKNFLDVEYLIQITDEFSLPLKEVILEFHEDREENDIFVNLHFRWNFSTAVVNMSIKQLSALHEYLRFTQYIR